MSGQQMLTMRLSLLLFVTILFVYQCQLINSTTTTNVANEQQGAKHFYCQFDLEKSPMLNIKMFKAINKLKCTHFIIGWETINYDGISLSTKLLENIQFLKCLQYSFLCLEGYNTRKLLLGVKFGYHFNHTIYFGEALNGNKATVIKIIPKLIESMLMNNKIQFDGIFFHHSMLYQYTTEVQTGIFVQMLRFEMLRREIDATLVFGLRGSDVFDLYHFSEFIDFFYIFTSTFPSIQYAHQNASLGDAFIVNYGDQKTNRNAIQLDPLFAPKWGNPLLSIATILEDYKMLNGSIEKIIVGLSANAKSFTLNPDDKQYVDLKMNIGVAEKFYGTSKMCDIINETGTVYLDPKTFSTAVENGSEWVAFNWASHNSFYEKCAWLHQQPISGIGIDNLWDDFDQFNKCELNTVFPLHGAAGSIITNDVDFYRYPSEDTLRELHILTLEKYKKIGATVPAAISTPINNTNEYNSGDRHRYNVSVPGGIWEYDTGYNNTYSRHFARKFYPNPIGPTAVTTTTIPPTTTKSTAEILTEISKCKLLLNNSSNATSNSSNGDLNSLNNKLNSLNSNLNSLNSNLNSIKSNLNSSDANSNSSNANSNSTNVGVGAFTAIDDPYKFCRSKGFVPRSNRPKKIDCSNLCGVQNTDVFSTPEIVPTKRRLKRTIGGTELIENFYPWMAFVKIEIQCANSEPLWQYCSGAFLSTGNVIVDAHCLFVSRYQLNTCKRNDAFNEEKNRYNTVDPRDITIGFGSYCTDLQQNMTGVKNFTIHPLFRMTDPLPRKNDLATIELNVDLDRIAHGIVPICLAKYLFTWNGEMTIIAGFGETKDLNKPKILKETLVPIVDDNYCDYIYNEMEIDYDTTNFFCAGANNRGIECGDCGGPVAVEHGGLFYLKGLSQFQYNNQSKDVFPDIHTNLKTHCDFIEDATGGRAKCMHTPFSSTDLDEHCSRQFSRRLKTKYILACYKSKNNGTHIRYGGTNRCKQNIQTVY